MDEGHPLKLARVACGLSTTLPELGELIKAQFYKLCPLTVPKAAELGLSGEEFLADMGFKQKVGAMSCAAVVGYCLFFGCCHRHHVAPLCTCVLCL
jgi:hypothetical protein